MENPDLVALLLLFLLALIAGTIDAMAGGGGLLTVPGLLATGIDPVSALGTNKFQGCFGTAAATFRFWMLGKLALCEHVTGVGATLAGALAGAIAVFFIPPQHLRTFIPFLLIGVALWVLCQPKLGEVARKARLSPLAYSLTILPLIGFYDGFLGPGTGSFYALSAVALLGLRLEEATARAKLFNFMSNLAPTLYFAAQGKIVWLYAAAMVPGMILGGTLGAHLVLRHGAKLIRPMLVVMSLAMSVKLLWDQGLFNALPKP